MTGSFIIYPVTVRDNLTHLNTGISYLKNKYKNEEVIETGYWKLHIFGDDIPYKKADSVKEYLFGTLLTDSGLDEGGLNNGNWNSSAKGAYCILTPEGNTLRITLDPLRKYHLFYNSECELLSNSFAAISMASEKVVLDRNGFFEKLLRGYNMAPHTIYESIKRPYYSHHISHSNISLTDNNYNYSEGPHYPSRKAALDAQISYLRGYFRLLKVQLGNKPVDLGISSGYDSRLILALLQDQEFSNVQLHTHAIEGVGMHSFEQIVAKRLAATADYDLKVERTRPLTMLKGEEVDKVIEENWDYYQGRNSHNMGAFTQTYTLAYKKAVLGNIQYALNGLGGEIYRNYYGITKNPDLKVFSKNYLFYRFAGDLVSEDILSSQLETFIKKVEERIGMAGDTGNSRYWIRRYYSEVRMPDGDASNNNAHNKHSYFITPFIEPEVLNGAYSIERYLGLGGKFEAELINEINSSLAEIPTHYGKSALKPGIRNEFAQTVKAIIPQHLLRLKFDKQKKASGFASGNKAFLEHLLNESAMFKRAWDNMVERFPEVNFKAIHYEFAAMVNACMLAVTLDKIKEHT